MAYSYTPYTPYHSTIGTTLTTPSFPSFPWELFTPCYTHVGLSSPNLYPNHGYSPHPSNSNPYSSYYSYYYNNYHQQLQPKNTSFTHCHRYQIYSRNRRDFDKYLQVSHSPFKKRSKKKSQKVIRSIEPLQTLEYPMFIQPKHNPSQTNSNIEKPTNPPTTQPTDSLFIFSKQKPTNPPSTIKKPSLHEDTPTVCEKGLNSSMKIPSVKAPTEALHQEISSVLSSNRSRNEISTEIDSVRKKKCLSLLRNPRFEKQSENQVEVSKSSSVDSNSGVRERSRSLILKFNTGKENDEISEVTCAENSKSSNGNSNISSMITQNNVVYGERETSFIDDADKDLQMGSIMKQVRDNSGNDSNLACSEKLHFLYYENESKYCSSQLTTVPGICSKMFGDCSYCSQSLFESVSKFSQGFFGESPSHTYSLLLQYYIAMEVFDKMPNKDVASWNAILCESISCVSSIYLNPKLFEAVVDVVAKFLKSDSHNLKHMGIDALSRLIKLSSLIAEKHQLVVINFLDDPDDTLKRKTFEQLHKVTKFSNVEVIVDRMIEYMISISDSHCKTSIASRCVDLAEKIAPSNHWFIPTMNKVVEHVGDLKVYEQAAEIEVPMLARLIRYYAGWTDNIHGLTIQADGPYQVHTLHELIGVGGQIIPWNFPLLLFGWKVRPTLAGGNTIVLKSSEQTPLSALYAAKRFYAAGLPAGVLNIVFGFGAAFGAALASYMDVDKIAFIGSTATGKIILQLAVKSNLKAATLELGGKSPFIICEDVDVNQAVKLAHFALFFNQGQCCWAGSRTFIHDRVYDEVIQSTNNSHFGLVAWVFTKNIDTANTLTRALRVGSVWVNCHDVSDATIPFSGYKMSRGNNYVFPVFVMGVTALCGNSEVPTSTVPVVYVRKLIFQILKLVLQIISDNLLFKQWDPGVILEP